MRTWGLVEPDELVRTVIVSPHLDDAVLGCGRFMAAHPDVTVLTVYAGRPARYPEPMTHWDTISGFRPGDDVLAARRAEDVAALAELGATPRWLDFVEHQYLDRASWVGPDQTVDTLAAELRALDPTAVLVPFGLANPDHGATHDAAMVVRGAASRRVVVRVRGLRVQAHPRSARLAGQPAVRAPGSGRRPWRLRRT